MLTLHGNHNISLTNLDGGLSKFSCLVHRCMPAKPRAWSAWVVSLITCVLSQGIIFLNFPVAVVRINRTSSLRLYHALSGGLPASGIHVVLNKQGNGHDERRKEMWRRSRMGSMLWLTFSNNRRGSGLAWFDFDRAALPHVRTDTSFI
ncbi:hypothetical protein D5086_019631 [Populus alba]|uniref:Uncharacterized protein n=1 Tax=Populus alba TaxID=43335 RepID=A0ACC4BHS3_POPAL